MGRVRLNTKYLDNYVNLEECIDLINKNKEGLDNLLIGHKEYDNYLGWLDVEVWGLSQVDRVEKIAREIKERADIFLLIGVGGSNQGARSVIKALSGLNGIEVLYAGNNLSSDYLTRILERLEGKSVYINFVAKNFATLEPGVSFRFFREYMKDRYGKTEASKRIIVTCSMGGSNLEMLSKDMGYKTIPFPINIGGRYSALSPVALLPMAVAGVDISELLKGAKEMEIYIKSADHEKNDAILYAALRNILYKKGYKIEILSCFEPSMEYFLKWWIQLFGESQGKNNLGLFPSACNYSEDLHSIGQFIQEGPRIIIESFLKIKNAKKNLAIPNDEIDGFEYLNNKYLEELNEAAYDATINAHKDGGVPCFEIEIPLLNEYYLGQLFYFFMLACYASSYLLGVNPFNQDGVESYKEKMFEILGK